MYLMVSVYVIIVIVTLLFSVHNNSIYIINLFKLKFNLLFYYINERWFTKEKELLPYQI